jgi:two-component system response regulator FlrC
VREVAACAAPATVLAQDSQPTDDARGSLADSLGQVERNVLLDAVRDGTSTRREIAERLGISPRTLRYKLARLRAAGVDVPAV